MSENGDGDVHLVVDAQYQTEDDVMTDVQPVEIVPEALRQPVLRDLGIANVSLNYMYCACCTVSTTYDVFIICYEKKNENEPYKVAERKSI